MTSVDGGGHHILRIALDDCKRDDSIVLWVESRRFEIDHGITERLGKRQRREATRQAEGGGFGRGAHTSLSRWGSTSLRKPRFRRPRMRETTGAGWWSLLRLLVRRQLQPLRRVVAGD